MPRVILPVLLILAAVLFWVFSVADCATQPSSRHRGVGKAAWIVIVIVFPVAGGILWFWVGRVRAGARPTEDDDAMLQRTGAIAEQNARIRELEQELADLDDDDDEHPDGR